MKECDEPKAIRKRNISKKNTVVVFFMFLFNFCDFTILVKLFLFPYLSASSSISQ